MALQSGLYDGACNPMFGAPPMPPDRVDLPICRVLFDWDKDPFWSGGEVERQWIIAADPLPIPADTLADLMATFDRGERVAVLAENAADYEAAVAAVLALCGGGQA